MIFTLVYTLCGNFKSSKYKKIDTDSLQCNLLTRGKKEDKGNISVVLKITIVVSQNDTTTQKNDSI